MITPDIEKFAIAYIKKDADFMRRILSTPIPWADLMNQLFYLPGHRFIHDYDSLSRELITAGFEKVYRSRYLGSCFEELNLDSEMVHRRVESLYIEALK